MSVAASHLDKGCEEALRLLLRPDIHHTIPKWMAQVGEGEKRGIIRLVRAANPNFMETLAVPRTQGHGGVPRVAEVIPARHAVKPLRKEPTTLLSAAKGMMQKSASTPALIR
mmetsp:Transcript_102953/g.204336  ORF Transcript_102953/g.204336 Transcript_102953/m.204336 type:complete len:112 (-) Transcript_102953:98-433(-)|eukprot:CAMPEP_0172851622 /NCGR_PEP_ID=MMETSP1075-20121228/51749_1 /TAXON_ID=2916 /ORGANISM="Ceratium fusus, Strain PA161109" /LENGTH=111 /DNA_ID=CAMNT_0013697675 /DNA_START=133 /DNA_END=468 /DNA_ORIENTATION=+